MKKYWLLLFASAALVLASCSKEAGDDRWIHYSDLGVIEEIGDGGEFYFKMTRDDGATLIAVENSSEDYELYVGKRVYCAYEIIETDYKQGGGKTCYIAVLGFDDILSKPVIRRSFLLEDYEHRSDSIGNDLIMAIYDRAWLGGNHLNIEFQYMKAVGSEGKHMINLVWDDSDSQERIIDLYLHHNAYGETRKNGYDMERAAGFVSFPILETVPEGAEEVTLRLHYNWDGKESDTSDNYMEKTFKPNYVNSTPVIPGNLGDNLIMTPPGAIVFLK